MENLPDAPWIVDAELNGLPYQPVYCPMCGAECEEFLLDSNDEICGCDNCCRSVDAWDWKKLLEGDRE